MPTSLFSPSPKGGDTNKGEKRERNKVFDGMKAGLQMESKYSPISLN